MKEIKMIFYNSELRKIRKNKQWSMRVMGDKIGCSWQTIWAWENNKRTPSERNIRLLAKCLDVPVNKISDLKPEYKKSELSPSELVKSCHNIIPEKYMKQYNLKNDYLKFFEIINKDILNSRILISAIFSSLDSIILYVKDNSLKYIESTMSFLTLLSLPKNYNIEGKTDYDLLSLNDAKKNTKEDEEVLKTGEPIIYKEGIILSKRKKKYGLISKYPIYDFEKNICGVVGSFVDITERKKNEQLSVLLEYCLHKSSVLIFMTKLSSHTIFGENPGELLYYTMFEDIIDINKLKNSRNVIRYWLDNVVHPNDRERELEYIKRKKWPDFREYRIIDKNNKVRWIEANVSIVDFTHEKCRFAFCKDITVRKKSEKASDIINFCLDKMNTGFAIYNLKTGKPIFLNKAIEKIFGYSLKYYFDHGIDFFFDNILHGNNNTEQKKIKPSVRIYSIRNMDGEKKYIKVNTSVKKIYGEICIVAIIYDTTKIMKARETTRIFKRILDKSAKGIGLVNLKTDTCIYLNNAMEKIYEQPLKKLYNYRDENWLSYDRKSDKKQEEKYRFAQSWPEKRIHKILTQNENRKYIETIVLQLNISNTTYRMSIHSDVTTEHMEQKRNEEIHAMHLDEATHGIVAVDVKTGYTVYVCKNTAGFLGRSPEQLSGKDGTRFWLNHCIHPDDRPLQENFFQKPRSFPSIKSCRIIRPNGEVRTLEVRLSNFKKFLKKDTYIALVNDIT
jgi:PAS domain S-box-containing protein